MGGFAHALFEVAVVDASVEGVRLLVGASPMTCQRAGVRGLTVACRVTLPPLEGAFGYARPAVALAPAFSFFLGDVACQSATERL